MRKFNLLVAPKSIRNSITKDSPIMKNGRSVGRKLTVLVVSFFITILIAVFVIGLLLGKSGAGKGSSPASSDSGLDMAGAGKKMVNKNIANPNNPAPDEFPLSSRQKTESDYSRPIAEKAEKPAVAKKKTEVNPAVAENIWRVRFGLCMFKASCERIVAQLESKGIMAELAPQAKNVTTYRVIIGPLGTESEAQDAGMRLAQAGHNTTLFMSDNHSFLSTRPYETKEDSIAAMRKIRSLGYKAVDSGRVEKQTVYKVYEGKYNTEKEAIKRRAGFKNKGIECIVEKAG